MNWTSHAHKDDNSIFYASGSQISITKSKLIYQPWWQTVAFLIDDKVLFRKDTVSLICNYYGCLCIIVAYLMIGHNGVIYCWGYRQLLIYVKAF